VQAGRKGAKRKQREGRRKARQKGATTDRKEQQRLCRADQLLRG
jgi:hypothetical protein